MYYSTCPNTMISDLNINSFSQQPCEIGCFIISPLWRWKVKHVEQLSKLLKNFIKSSKMGFEPSCSA